MRIIVGLGNPGPEYEKTRHNVGFMALDRLAEKYGLVWENNKKFFAEVAKNNDLILIKPRAFMNNSGRAVAAALSYYKLLPKKLGIIKIAQADLTGSLTVIHDDLDIELGKFKISVDSRSAGHKGVQSIIDQLKSKNFKRVRVGIGQRTEPAPGSGDPERRPAAKFVLAKFKPAEQEIINRLLDKLIEQL